MKIRLMLATAIAAGALLIPIGAATASQDPPAHNAVLPCNLPVGQADTIVSPGLHDCIVQYASLSDAAAVVHTAMVEGRTVFSNSSETGFIETTGAGPDTAYVVRVADPSAGLAPVTIPSIP